MIERKAFRSLSSGLYLITAREGDTKAGCVVNTVVQVASNPPMISVAINKENTTAQIIRETGQLVVTALSEDAPLDLISTFGFYCSRDTNKFASFYTQEDEGGIPYVLNACLARFSVKVTETVDAATHWLFVGEVEHSEVISQGNPMTYAYYHAVKGGKTPPRAATFNEGDSLNL
jgi:flavin reductase (DIM6/NTAB) family NADH-FMN oxidoreductase RutF